MFFGLIATVSHGLAIQVDLDELDDAGEALEPIIALKEAITPLLQSPNFSLTLTEKGSLEPVCIILRHPAFRLFASMNPTTDVGK